MTLDTLLRLYSRIHKMAQVKGFKQDADDIAQDVAVKLLEGRHKHATVNQMFIDYLRRMYGRPHYKFYQLKYNVKFPLFIEDLSPAIEDLEDVS